MTNNNRSTTRIGIHYFPDTIHYREQDLQTWLPELASLGIGWMTLIAPLERAIPEEFIRGLIEAGIAPVLHFPLPLKLASRDLRLDLLFNNYARWGVHHAALFDRPNIRRSWEASAWIQENLVDRFLDLFIPQAESALQAGLTPLFPPLEPGGDYWDTAFLQTALQSIQRRGHAALLQSLGLSANAWTYNRPLDWGAGGPESWPGAQPYHTPANSQDQIGFRIFDWYQAIAQTEVGKALPVFLLRAGSRPADYAASSAPTIALRQHAEANLAIVKLFSRPAQEPKTPLAVNRINFEANDKQPADLASDQVACVNFWLLSAVAGSHELDCVWYHPDGSILPAVTVIKQWVKLANKTSVGLAKEPFNVEQGLAENTPANGNHPIDHYLLLPIYSWGIADWDLEAIKPFLMEYHPTIGFSPYEALLANRVTVFGDVGLLPDGILSSLQASGCLIEKISDDGTLLAI